MPLYAKTKNRTARTTITMMTMSAINERPPHGGSSAFYGSSPGIMVTEPDAQAVHSLLDRAEQPFVQRRRCAGQHRDAEALTGSDRRKVVDRPPVRRGHDAAR